MNHLILDEQTIEEKVNVSTLEKDDSLTLEVDLISKDSVNVHVSVNGNSVGTMSDLNTTDISNQELRFGITPNPSIGDTSVEISQVTE